MKITFGEDGSFLEIFPSGDNKKITLIMCGRKSYREVTMSSTELSKEQVSEMIKFLTEWQETEE
jgi:hypothetical protein